MRRPAPRGPLSRALLTALAGRPAPVPAVQAAAEAAVERSADVLADDDVQLSLTVLYELAYRGVDRVAERLEWEPDLLRVRATLEAPFEAAIRALVPVPETDARTAHEVAEALFALTSADDGPSVSSYIAKQATDEQVRELLVHRSVYHLKEADPHSWALPRLTGRAKSALI